MSDANAFDLGKFIPGFDFLQKLASQRPGAGAPVPGLGGWVAPTVSVDELDRRIKELKAVQFWLDQNATAIKATIQALEVQKMTLATLQGMNLSMAEVARAFTVPTDGAPAAAASAAPAAATPPAGWPYAGDVAAAPSPAPERAPDPAPAPPPAADAAAPAPPAARARAARKPAPKATAAPPAGAPAAALADPMLWWGALTQQFQQIAAQALQDGGRAANAIKTEAASAHGTGAGGQKSSKKSRPARAPAAGQKPAGTPARRAASQAVAQAGGQAKAKPRAGAKTGGRAAAKTGAKSGGKAVAKAGAKAGSKAGAKAGSKAGAKSGAGEPAKSATRPAGQAAADQPARTLAGWPLPPPFKLGR
jgi:hypothetical protein